ncbi:MAG: bifunctional riboflavin kinase/FAD synthetase [Bacteroidota bacterium]
MKIYQSIDEFEPTTGLVMTIGAFDGVHIGHRKLLSRIVEVASQKNLETLVLTFFPHPRMVLSPEEHGVELLSTTTEKIALLSETGIDHLVIHPFSRDFSSMTAEAFVRQVIFEKLRASQLVIGYDHRFGNQRQGSIDELKRHGLDLGFTVEEIAEQDVDDMAVSSSRIRLAIKEGRVEEACQLLNRPYELSGIVVRGNQVGRTIGFPTANLRIPESYKLLPAEGVYVVSVHGMDFVRNGMMSIGRRPTLESHGKLALEVHILDFDGDIYGSTLQVKLLSKLRDNIRFNNIEALKSQLMSDRIQALRYFARTGNHE